VDKSGAKATGGLVSGKGNSLQANDQSFRELNRFFAFLKLPYSFAIPSQIQCRSLNGSKEI